MPVPTHKYIHVYIAVLCRVPYTWMQLSLHVRILTLRFSVLRYRYAQHTHTHTHIWLQLYIYIYIHTHLITIEIFNFAIRCTNACKQRQMLVSTYVNTKYIHTYKDKAPQWWSSVLWWSYANAYDKISPRQNCIQLPVQGDPNIAGRWSVCVCMCAYTYVYVYACQSTYMVARI